MSPQTTKVGIISCSGEATPEGTISRLATRRVLELLRPNTTVTLCLPLFLAGNEAERSFAKTHPTITIDGCDKQCAKWGTEEHQRPGQLRTGGHRYPRNPDGSLPSFVAERCPAGQGSGLGRRGANSR